MSPAQVVPDDDVQSFWDNEMVALAGGQVLTNHITSISTQPPDLGGDILNHSVDQSAFDVDGSA